MLTNPAVLADFLANATPSHLGNQLGLALADAQQKRRVRSFMTSNTACMTTPHPPGAKPGME